MFGRLLILLATILVVSCGEDMVDVVDTTMSPEPQEIFEVNIVGYATDSESSFLSDVDISLDDNVLELDPNSFFVNKEVLIPKEGKVIKAEKEGYLTSYKRVYHYRSLEEVTVNISMEAASVLQEVGSQGGQLIDQDAELQIGSGVFSSDNEVVFYSSFSRPQKIDFDPFIITESGVEFLDDYAMFFAGASSGTSANGIMNIALTADQSISFDDYKVYKYNEISNTWEVTDLPHQNENDKLSFDIDSFGWWSIARAIPTVYGELSINQYGPNSGDNYIGNFEIAISKSDLDPASERLFTNNQGKIVKYFPTETEQEIAVGDETILLSDVFASGNSERTVIFDQIVNQLSGEVYDCDLEKQDGYVALISDGEYSLKQMEDGRFSLNTLINTEEIQFEFYNESEDLILSKNIETDKIENTVSFVACDAKLSVEEGDNLTQDFDNCIVRVKPIESFIVAERSETEQILISFKGDEVGLYDGLVFGNNISGFDLSEVEKDTKVDIKIYDKATEVIAGFVEGIYKNGDTYNVTFIGGIDQ